MRFVVGLGNPGERYRRTRHNVGFRVVDHLAARAGHVEAGVQAGAWVAEARLGSEPVLLVKPLSYMNLSGVPVAQLLAGHDGTAADLIVIVDDAVLELGTIRVRERGSHGGHNGLRSLVEELDTEEFARVRVGVCKAEVPDDLAAFVLADFTNEDLDLVEEVVARAADATACLATDGVAAAMNRFNAPLQRRPPTEL
ncbi:MAG: aminoacyl-tRNA hydrolase [Vicinamibacteria bacterium]